MPKFVSGDIKNENAGNPDYAGGVYQHARWKLPLSVPAPQGRIRKRFKGLLKRPSNQSLMVIALITDHPLRRIRNMAEKVIIRPGIEAKNTKTKSCSRDFSMNVN
jgi:hypothetical protein